MSVRRARPLAEPRPVDARASRAKPRPEGRVCERGRRPTPSSAETSTVRRPRVAARARHTDNRAHRNQRTERRARWRARPLAEPRPVDARASRAKPRPKGRVCERGRRPTPRSNAETSTVGRLRVAARATGARQPCAPQLTCRAEGATGEAQRSSRTPRYGALASETSPPSRGRGVTKRARNNPSS